MVLKPNKTIKAAGFTAFFVIAAGMLFYFFLFRTSSLGAGLKNLLSILNPIIYGYIIAYILNPVMCLFENGIFWILNHFKVKPSRRISKLARALATFITLAITLEIVYILASIVIPELITSLQSIIKNYHLYVENINEFVNKLIPRGNSDLDGYTETVMNNYSIQFEEWLNQTMIPSLTGFMPHLTSGLFDVITFLKNLLLGIVISVYVLIAKETLEARVRRFIYSVWKLPTANRILFNLRFADEKFGGFLIGKIIDSAIIGVICYLGCLIFDFPYAILISVFIGITNVIPFFGPFIGAIPSAVLIFVVDPLMALLFVLFILGLQQFDGNILGPKILGSSVGISSYMVMVSILIGSGLFGVTGMIIAVPLAAIIIAYTQGRILRETKKKKLPGDLESYNNLEKIDPVTHELIRFDDHQETPSLISWLRRKGNSSQVYTYPLEENPWDKTMEQVEREDAELGSSAGRSRTAADDNEALKDLLN